MIQVVLDPDNHSPNDHPTSPGIITIPLQTMAQSRPLPDNHHTTDFTKEYGQLPAKYLPATPSPLSPRSSRPASLPRRHTVSGPTPSSTTPAAVSDSETTPTTASVPTSPRAKRRHSRRHSGSMKSPTERLMRYKAALAWRSATTAPSSPRPDDAYLSPLRRHPVQGLMNDDDSDGGNITTTRTAPHDGRSPSHSTRDQCNNTNQNQAPHHQYKDSSEKANPHHFIIQVQQVQVEPPLVVSPQAPQPVPIFKDTTSSSSLETPYYQQRDQQAVGYQYQYGYGTNYTTTSNPDGGNGYHKGTTGHPLDTHFRTTFTLQRAALTAAVVLFCGLYMAICAFSLIAARGHDHDDGDDLLVEGIYGYLL